MNVVYVILSVINFKYKGYKKAIRSTKQLYTYHAYTNTEINQMKLLSLEYITTLNGNKDKH